MVLEIRLLHHRPPVKHQRLLRDLIQCNIHPPVNPIHRKMLDILRRYQLPNLNPHQIIAILKRAHLQWIYPPVNDVFILPFNRSLRDLVIVELHRHLLVDAPQHVHNPLYHPV